MFFPFHDDNPTTRAPVLTCALIAVNVVSFLWIQRLEPFQRQAVVCRRGFIPKRIDQLKDPRLVIEVPIDRVVRHPARGWVRVRDNLPLEANRPEILASLVTCMFLHGGWLHLLGNMWFLWIFGNNVEDRLGPLLFLVVYLLGGLLGSGCHWMMAPASAVPVIGASGAVATVLGAYAITWPWARVHTFVFLLIFITVIDLPALFILGFWFLLQLWEGTRLEMAQGVAWWAHVGGFVAGMLLMPVFSAVVGAEQPRRSRSRSETADDST